MTSSLYKRLSYYSGCVVYVDSGTYYAMRRSDGTLYSGSDPATVIQWAITNGGGRVFITAGTYAITTGLTFASSNVVVEGEGQGTVLTFDGSTVTTLFKMADTAARQFITIKNIKITSTSTGSGTGLDMSYFQHSTFDGLRFTGVNRGIYSGPTTSVYYNKIGVVTITVSGVSSAGVYLDTIANSNHIEHIRVIGDSNTTGLYLNGHRNVVDYVDVETGPLYGIDLGTSAHDNTIFCYLEGNQTGLRLASGCNGNFIAGFCAESTTADVTDNSDNINQINLRSGTGAYTSSIRIPVIQSGQAGAAQPAATEYYINLRSTANTPNRMKFNVPTGSQYDFLVNGSAIFNMSASTINYNNITIQNATLRAANVRFGDGTDQTKKFGFDASNVSTSTTRTFTAPDADGYIMISNRSGLADPTTTDIKAGEATVWKNTNSGTIKLWVNDGGVMKSVALT